MYSIHNEEKSVVAERFIRTLRTKIYKYMTSVSTNVYIDKLDDIVDEYNNTYHRTIKMKPGVKDNTDIDFKKEVNGKDSKFKVGDHVSEFLKTKIFLLKDTHQIGLKKFLLLVKLKIQFHGHILLMISMVKKLLKHFEEELQKINQKEFRIEKVIKRKGDELYVKWKGYDNSFNSWIDKKSLV